MKKYAMLVLIAISLCACSAGLSEGMPSQNGGTLSPSSSSIPESSEVSSSEGIAPDYKNSPYFLPVGSMEFTVIDNTAVPKFEGKEVEVEMDYFTSLEAELTGEKMSKMKGEQEIQGLQISPDGKNYAYFLITYIPDEITGEVTYFNEYSEPFMVNNVQLIIEYGGETKEYWRADNYLMESMYYNDLKWLGNEYISLDNLGITNKNTYDIINVTSGERFEIVEPDLLGNIDRLENIKLRWGIEIIDAPKHNIVPMVCKAYRRQGEEGYSVYCVCFYNLNEKRWLENHIHFTEFEYAEFHITWSEQTDDLLLFLQEEAIGYTYHIWSYNPITDQRVELKAFQCIGGPMMVVELRDDLVIWRSMRKPEKIFLYDYKNDQWICYINGLYEEGIFHKNKNLLYIEEEIIDDRPKYIGNDIFVYDLKNKVKYYHLTPRSGNDE